MQLPRMNELKSLDSAKIFRECNGGTFSTMIILGVLFHLLGAFLYCKIMAFFFWLHQFSTMNVLHYKIV